MNKININGKNYDMSSPTSDKYKKLIISSKNSQSNNNLD